MKFKDLRVGQRFTMDKFSHGHIETKINIKKGGVVYTTKGNDGIKGFYMEPDDEVNLVDED